EKVAPTARNVHGWRRAAPNADRPLNAARTRPAIATRSSADQTGPISGETTRKKRNAAPQTAPREKRRARCVTVTADWVEVEREGGMRASSATGSRATRDERGRPPRDI